MPRKPSRIVVHQGVRFRVATSDWSGAESWKRLDAPRPLPPSGGALRTDGREVALCTDRLVSAEQTFLTPATPDGRAGQVVRVRPVAPAVQQGRDRVARLQDQATALRRLIDHPQTTEAARARAQTRLADIEGQLQEERLRRSPELRRENR